MSRHTLTLLGEHYEQLKRQLLGDGKERGALVLCGRSTVVDPWTGIVEHRLLSQRVFEVPDGAYTHRSSVSMTWSTTPFYECLKATKDGELAVAVFHTHPSGPLAFSPADDIAEQELFSIAFNRLESDRSHLSVILTGKGDLIARSYGADLKPEPVELIRSIGSRWRLWYEGRGSGQVAEQFDRQIRAFGVAATQDLGNLRVGLVGCGGTGSAVAMLLARMGVRRVALFDDDILDNSNLNRLHFASQVDANLRTPKVDVVAKGMAGIGFPLEIIRVPHPVDHADARDALRACDVVFGCTDDNLGRSLLDRLSRFYAIPVVDLGLLIEPNDEGGYDTFDGRVTVLQPGSTCLHCSSLIQPAQLAAEALRRSDPRMYARRRRAGYVAGEGDPNPMVVTFTTELAAMAVNELLHRLTGFRGAEGSCSERLRRFDWTKDGDALPAAAPVAGCKLCDARRYDGRGDVTPFLDQTW